MRRRTSGAKGVALLILLSAGAGVVLLLLGRASIPWETAEGPFPTLSPSPSPTGTPLPTLPPPTPTPSPLLHTVQPGETLASIAAAYGVPLADLIAANDIPDPNLIRAGQTLVIPGRWVTPTPAPPTAAPAEAAGPSPTPIPRPVLPTLTPSGPPMVEIAGVLGAGDLAREVVRLRNRGGTVSLEGWTLSDASGDRYVFPRLILFPGAEVALYSGPGVSDPTHLYWNRPAPAWQSGELLTLCDREGAMVDTYVVP